MLNITATDFDYLTTNQMQWGKGGPDWKGQKKRFELDIRRPIDFETPGWIYWCSSYPDLILARTFLEENNHSTTIMYDTAMLEWVILTDYAGSWPEGE
jgi:hypothetical protein